MDQATRNKISEMLNEIDTTSMFALGQVTESSFDEEFNLAPVMELIKKNINLLNFIFKAVEMKVNSIPVTTKFAAKSNKNYLHNVRDAKGKFKKL